MKRLFFVRHGITDMNVAGHFSGLSEAVLTDEGRKQAKTTGLNFKNNLPRVDYIICSTLGRTLETARIIADEIGFPIEKIERNALFVERNFGVLEGTKGDDYYSSHEYEELDSVEGVETIEQLQHRAQTALQYVKSIEADNVLVVSHGSFGRAFRRAVLDLPHDHEYIQPRFHIDNAEVVELI